MSKILEKFAHLFIPRHTNNHKARILHTSSIFTIVGILVFYQLGLQLLPTRGYQVLGYASNIPPETVIALTNQKRAENGLPELSTNSVLAQAAQAKAADMLNHDYWAHVSPDGTEPWYFFTESGYRYRYAGENLARDFADANSAVDAWMASPSHRDNILNTKYREIGVAVAEGDLAGVDSTIIVQFFGTQLNSAGDVQTAQAKIETTPTPTIALESNVTQVSPIPTETPEVVLTQAPIEENSGSLATSPAFVSEKSDGKLLFSPFNVTRAMSLVTIIVLGFVMIVDAWIVYKKRITRLSGRNFAHLAFLGVILSIIIIIGAGRII